MEIKNKTILGYLFYLVLGFFSMIMLSFTSMVPYSSYTSGGVTETSNVYFTYDGYEVVKLFSGIGDGAFATNFAGVVAAIFQLLFILIAIIMIVWAILGLLTEIGLLNVKFKLFGIEYFNFGKYMFCGLAGLSFLVSLFMWIYCGSPAQTISFYGETQPIGLGVGFGLFFNFIFLCGLFTGLALLWNKGLLNKWLVEPHTASEKADKAENEEEKPKKVSAPTKKSAPAKSITTTKNSAETTKQTKTTKATKSTK